MPPFWRYWPLPGKLYRYQQAHTDLLSQARSTVPNSASGTSCPELLGNISFSQLRRFRSCAVRTHGCISERSGRYAPGLVSGTMQFLEGARKEPGRFAESISARLSDAEPHLCRRSWRREPSNRLTPGFISSAKYQLGAMERNGCMMNQAMVRIANNTNIYPQFHGFVEGWVLTAMLPPEHPAYEQAVEAYYETLDSCAGIRVPRSFRALG